MKRNFSVFLIGILSAQLGLAQQAVEFHSSDKALETAFSWAKSTALSYKSKTNDPVGPWYESALPPRDAFCMRDVSHQCIGAEILGMKKENQNMFRKFAENISASKDWCSFWEIDKLNRPSPADYKSDHEFWYNLNANFDFMNACWRLYLWTGDSVYINDPVFKYFFEKTVREYISKWVLQSDSLLLRPAHPNAPQPFDEQESFDRCRGLPSYSEGIQNIIMGVDLVAAIYRGLITYSSMRLKTQDRNASDFFTNKAEAYRTHLEKYWWDSNSGLYNTYYSNEGKFGKSEGETFLLWFDVLRDTVRLTSTIKHLQSMDLNVENLSYLPLQYYRHGYFAEARSLILHLSDAKTERREYPEVSFGVVEGIVQGMMGVEADVLTGTVTTLYRGRDYDTASIISLPILQTKISIRNLRESGGEFINQGNKPVKWKACFDKKFNHVYDGKKWIRLLHENKKTGEPVSYMIATLKAGEKITLKAK